MTVDKKCLLTLDAVKLFNTAVTVSRLYPAISPQVSNAVERAYRGIKEYNRKQGALSFGRTGTEFLLCGKPVPDELREEVHELVVFRHLALLGVEHVVLPSSIDRRVFDRILSAFLARKEKINREGGGRLFIIHIELEDFFPEIYEPPEEPEKKAEEDAAGILRITCSTVTEEQLTALSGEFRPPQSPHPFRKYFTAGPETSSSIVAAGIAGIVNRYSSLQDRERLAGVERFGHFLDNVGALIPADEWGRTASQVALTLMGHMDGAVLGYLFAQEYRKGFAETIFAALIENTPNGMFGEVVDRLRKRIEFLGRQKRGDSPQAKLIESALVRLLDSVKGKQLLGREKAQALIREGEKKRQQRRLETGVEALLKGNTEGLKSDEIVFNLPATVFQLIEAGESDDALTIIERVAAEMLSGDDSLRRRLIQSLVLIADRLLDDSNMTWLEKISGALVSWVRESDEGDYIYEKCLSILQAVMNHSWDRSNYSRADQILSVFYKIRSGQLQKSPPVVALIGRVQDLSFNRPRIEQFFNAFLKNKGDGQVGQRLSMLGRPSANLFIDALLKNNEMSERLRIVELLGNMGHVAAPVAFDRIKEPMPWYGKRNLLKLAAEIAGPEYIDHVVPFLKHEDLRVQREAFICVYVISGDRRREAMLKCLDNCSEIMYPQAVKALLPYSDKEIALRLCALLEDQKNFSGKVREPLIEVVLKVLARSGSEDARRGILKFVDSKKVKPNDKLSDQVWKNAEVSLRQLEEVLGPEINGTRQDRIRETGQEESPRVRGVKKVQEKPDPSVPKKDFSRLEKSEKVVSFLEQDDKDGARGLLMELVEQKAGAGKFSEAEAYRAWIMEIDPMALTDIIRAAEIIEEEKIASVDNSHAETWAELYEVLSTEEFAVLYHAMKRKTYQSEETIVVQGAMQSCLYFISRGKVKIHYKDRRGDALVKVAVKGEILGAETVFDASVWTVSATCMATTEVMILKLRELAKWRDDYPSLESKLSDFCMKSESLKQFFKASGKDRRHAKRHKIAGRTTNVLLDSKGGDTGITSKGDLFDVSAGGVSFYLRISQKKNARLLLGRNMRITVASSAAPGKQVGLKGTIIAVRGHQAMENEYSVHVKFTRELESIELQGIIDAAD